MTLLQIAAMTAAAAILGRLRKGRELALLAMCTFIVFWLQPMTSIPALRFWLPFATVGLTIMAWILTSRGGEWDLARTWPALAIIAAVVVLMLAPGWARLPTRLFESAPGPFLFLSGTVLLGCAGALLWRQQRWTKFYAWGFVAAILAAFAVIKSPQLMTLLEARLRLLLAAGEPDARGMPLAWLGFSYIAFRLIHAIRDRQTGRLPAGSLGEFVVYALFFPALAAGPIDRFERFVQDLRNPVELRDAERLEAGFRILLGLFKKFVIADLLAVISISDLLVAHVRTPGWMWLYLYAYALRIYLDFSGYTDVAIGLGRLLGVKLPENFAGPYLRQNISLFWNAWHMSLTQWFRAYVFNPLARILRSGPVVLPTWLSILVTQLVTMLLIGLWHGITWGFAAWGLWHGLGLFVHNRWSAWVRGRWASSSRHTTLANAASVAGTVLTFHFVAIGWLFFALSSPAIAWQAITVLFGSA